MPSGLPPARHARCRWPLHVARTCGAWLIYIEPRDWPQKHFIGLRLPSQHPSSDLLVSRTKASDSPDNAQQLCASTRSLR